MNEITQAQSKVPAYALARTDDDFDDSLSANVGAGFPVVSIRGRAWRIVQGGEERVVTLPGTDDPAPSIEVVILKANKALSKVYYAGAYVEGSDSAPDCFSHDGVAPDPSVENPQSPRCATCKQNVWGAKITPQGTKTKACSDSRRLVVVPAGELNNPMLLRVPAASLGDLAEFGRVLARRGIRFHAMVTKLGFDPQAAYPKLTFKPVRFVDAQQFEEINKTRDLPIVNDICGVPSAAPAPIETPAPAQAAPAPDVEPEPPVVEATTEARKRGRPAGKTVTKPEAPVAQAGDNIEADLDKLLEGFDV